MSGFPLQADTGATGHLRLEQIERLYALIDRHIADGRYPGAQIALAQNGRLLIERSFGQGRLDASAPGGLAGKVDDRSLWLLYSNTKVVLATALWKLFEQGAFRFTDRVVDHVPEFKRNGKRDITLLQVITHQGGFPNATVPPDCWDDHEKMKARVCNFSLEWTPGSRVHYHGLSAHWVLATVIEAVTGKDFRDYVREAVIEPLGLGDDLFLGLPAGAGDRLTEMVEPTPDGKGYRSIAENNTPEWRRAGIPGGGAYGTARGMAALYQMMLGGGELNGVRLLSPRTLAYAIRNFTGDRVDEFMGMPMHRGLGPHLRGTTPAIRGLGAIAPAGAFGHGGVGSSYCWGDPESGISFVYLTNCRVPDPWHSDRLDVVSNLVHSAIL
ncbi:MAG: serine hydrolase domain-containing protein [Burkholderiaceae bacterium]